MWYNFFIAKLLLYTDNYMRNHNLCSPFPSFNIVRHRKHAFIQSILCSFFLPLTTLGTWRRKWYPFFSRGSADKKNCYWNIVQETAWEGRTGHRGNTKKKCLLPLGTQQVLDKCLSNSRGNSICVQQDFQNTLLIHLRNMYLVPTTE